jgi:hypothetical protein
MPLIFQVRFPDPVFRSPSEKSGLTREEVIDDLMRALRIYVSEHVECVNGPMPGSAKPTSGGGAKQAYVPSFRQLTGDDL